jgi:hypothetical protein
METAYETLETIDRDAYNGAFWDLGFRWQWDEATYRELARIPAERERVRGYIARQHAHLLSAYDPDFLAQLSVERKCSRREALLAARSSGRPAELTCDGVLEA